MTNIQIAEAQHQRAIEKHIRLRTQQTKLASRVEEARLNVERLHQVIALRRGCATIDATNPQSVASTVQRVETSSVSQVTGEPITNGLKRAVAAGAPAEVR